MKKLLMILACCVAFLAVPLTSYAAKDQTGTYEYEVRNGKAVLTRYATDSNATRVTVPDKVDGYEVVGLEGTFKENQRIEKITLPYGIEFLGDETFLKCRKLQDINFPDSILEIGFQCLAYTSIESATIPCELTEIPGMAFADCENLISVDWGDSKIKKIDNMAFFCCESLQVIKIPDTVIKLGSAIFSGCNSVEEILIPQNVSEIDSLYGPIASGTNLKRIINMANIEWDKSIYEYHLEDANYDWFDSENGYETVNSLMPNTTIYRHKKDSSEKYVNKYYDIINQTIFLSKEYNSSSEILKKAKSLMPEMQIKTLSCEITLENFYPATDGSADLPEGYAGSGCFKINASNSALENDKYVAYIWFSIELQKYIENNPVQPEQPDEPEDPEKPDDPEIPTQPEEPSKPDMPIEPSNPDSPDDPKIPENPGNDKIKIKIQEIELLITCTKPNENIRPENIKVDFKTEHCHIKEINVTRYNKAEIIIVPDDGYIFSNNIDEWANICGNDIEINSIDKSRRPNGEIKSLGIEVANTASTEPSEGDTQQILFDKYIDKIDRELQKIREEKISMADANDVDSVRKYLLQKLSKPSIDKIEMDVIVESKTSGAGRFLPAIAGTIDNKTGKNGDCSFDVRIWEKGDKEILKSLYGFAVIKATEYISSSSGSSSGSGGGSSSGGGGRRCSSGGSSSNNAPQGLLISKQSIIMGTWELVDGKWKLKISDGSCASSQWAFLDGKWYLLGADGYMLTS